MMHILSDWWSLALAKAGVTGTLLLLLYAAGCVWLLFEILRGLYRHLRYQMAIRKRLDALHGRETVSTTLLERARRRRDEWDGPDAA